MTQNPSGFILLKKEAGPTSFKALAPIKKKFRKQKVGHAGTLDPDASGLLIVAVGKATRLISRVEAQDKTYEFFLHIGMKTDSYDTSGEVLEQDETQSLSISTLKQVLPSFLGMQQQVPPVYSAIKVNGKRACDRVRNGEEVELKSRAINIDSLEVLEEVDSGKVYRLRCKCSKGTYIRSLGLDLAKKCGVFGCVSHIHRTHIGNYALKNASIVEDAEDDVNVIEPHLFLKEIESMILPEDILNEFSFGRAVSATAFSIGQNLEEGVEYFAINNQGATQSLFGVEKNKLKVLINF